LVGTGQVFRFLPLYPVEFMLITRRDNLVLVQPQGHLDQQCGVALNRALCDVCPNHCPFWIIDLTHIDFINSAGLTALVNGLSLARRQQCHLVLLNPTPAVKLVLEITGLDRLFQVLEVANADLRPVSYLSQVKSIAQAA